MPSFLTPYLFWIKLASAALALAAAFASGMWLEGTIKDNTILTMQRERAQGEADAYKAGIEHQAAADKITHDRDMANAAAHQKIVTITQKIIQKVPTYVTPETDARFPLPCGFVRLHDAAADGVEPAAVPFPPDLTDGQSCPVTASYAASIISGNYGLAIGWRADLQTWEKWGAEQKAKWDSK